MKMRYTVLTGLGDNKSFQNLLCNFVNKCIYSRIQSCFANFYSKSGPDPVPTRRKQSDSYVTVDKYNSSKQPVTFFSANTKFKSNPATAMITSRLILLEAAGVQI